MPLAAVPHPITIVDYGVGNIASLVNMLEYIGVDSVVAGDPAGIAAARSLILPGVGAFDAAMGELHARGLIAPLDEAVLGRRVPVLGVCLGMQILGRGSEEGQARGLGWIDAVAMRLRPPPDSGLKVPHVGWSEVVVSRPSALFPEGGATERFYFVHSYALQCADSAAVAATVSHGGEVCCAVANGNVFGVQFHPEKSHKFGMRLLSSYARHCQLLVS